MIEVHGLCKTYETVRHGRVEALRSVDLDVEKGEVVSLIGPSGCGKSSLLHMIGGMRSADSGEVILAGERVTGPIPDRVSFVFQDYTLFPWRTVLANVDFGLQLRGITKAERQSTAMNCLGVVGLSNFAAAYPSELSGGMQQRVALARALALDPDVLLMDEPFGALDEQTRTVLNEDFSKIVEETSKTTLFVTHSLTEAIFLADRVVVMSARPGRVKEVMVVAETRPRSPAFMSSESFNELRGRLFDSLHDEFLHVAHEELEGGRADE